MEKNTMATALEKLFKCCRVSAAVRICRSVPCGPWKGEKVRDRACLGWDPNSPVPPLSPRHSHLLSLAGLAGRWRCSSRRAPRPGHPATAACGQWSGRHTSAHGCRPGPRRLSARPARGGCRHDRLAAWLARGGCRHGRPAAVAGTAGPPQLPARPAHSGCWHGMPAAAARKWIRECLNSDLS
jgi:hypothetical protein